MAKRGPKPGPRARRHTDEQIKENRDARSSRYYKTHTEEAILASKKSYLKRNYGLTIEEWQIMFDKQEGRCKICGIHQSELKQALVVDHDHTTGEIRGLLCNKCNRALGYFNDSTRNLKKAIEYLGDVSVNFSNSPSVEEDIRQEKYNKYL